MAAEEHTVAGPVLVRRPGAEDRLLAAYTADELDAIVGDLVAYVPVEVPVGLLRR